MAETGYGLQPAAPIKVVPGGLLLPQGVESPQEMVAAWHTHPPLQETWHRWVRAKPTERGAALAPAIGGSDSLTAALAVYLLERHDLPQVQSELLLCLHSGTIHWGRGSAFAPLLWDAICETNAPAAKVGHALADLVARSPRPRPPQVLATVHRALTHPSGVVRSAALLALSKEQASPTWDIQQLTRDAESGPAARRVVMAYIERGRHRERFEDQCVKLLELAEAHPAALDALKEWVFDDWRRQYMERRFARGTVCVYEELLRDSDPEVRSAACLWLSTVCYPQLDTRDAVERLVHDPLCVKAARYALDRWETWAKIGQPAQRP